MKDTEHNKDTALCIYSAFYAFTMKRYVYKIK